MPNILNPSIIKLSLPAPTIDNSVLVGKTDGTISWISQDNLFYKPIDNIIYVTKNGKDTNNGKSLLSAKSSIKSALNAATAGTTIIVSSGTYVEQTPLTCPPNVTITAQDSSVYIKSANSINNVFYLNTGTIIDGITIIDTRAPSVAFSIRPNTQIIKAPIIKNCSLITGPFLNDNTLFVPNQTIQLQEILPTQLPIINNDLVPVSKRINETGAGTFIAVDGTSFAVNSLEKLIIVESCNIFSQGGIGILVKNSAGCYANNCLVKFCNFAYKSETGGQLILTNCTSSYGNYALHSSGFDNSLLTTGTLSEVISYSENGIISQIKVTNLQKQPIIGSIIDINDEKYYISNVTPVLDGISYLSIISNLTDIALETEISIYNNSKITANNHCFEYIGSGITYNALPENNGQENDLKKVTESNYGSIYFSSNNTSGIFKIGDIFEINQITGEVTTNAINESLINIGSIGPLIRNGVAVGVAVKEISNNSQLLASTNTIDPYTVPTQKAVYDYLTTNYFPVTGGVITGSTSIQNINITNNLITSIGTNQNIKISPNGTGVIDVDSSTITNLSEPINDTDAATKKFVVDLVQGGISPTSIISILYGSDEDNGTLTLRSTQSSVKSNTGIILDDGIPSTSTTTGTLVVYGGVGVDGALNAKTKSFNIEHPLDPAKRLCYGSLESPYHGIRLTGKGIVSNGICIINLPKYICKLVKEENSQVQLTNIKHNQILWVDNIDVLHNCFTVKTIDTTDEYQFFWSFTAIRNDVEELIVEV